MSESNQDLAEVVPAPASESTVTPDVAITAPEVNVGDEQRDENTPKTFTQDELDAAIGKRLAREQRKWEREHQARLTEATTRKAVGQDTISREQYDSDDEYIEALSTAKAEQISAQREQQTAYRKIVAAYEDGEDKARDKYDDFDQVTRNPNLNITSVMLETIQHSDIGPDVAYYLGMNPKEASRIAQLPPYIQAREIGKIEAKITLDPPVKKTSSAPPPINPITARGNNSSTYDTTDPRSTKVMSDSQWIEAERQRQIKKLKARMNS